MTERLSRIPRKGIPFREDVLFHFADLISLRGFFLQLSKPSGFAFFQSAPCRRKGQTPIKDRCEKRNTPRSERKGDFICRIIGFLRQKCCVFHPHGAQDSGEGLSGGTDATGRRNSDGIVPPFRHVPLHADKADPSATESEDFFHREHARPTGSQWRRREKQRVSLTVIKNHSRFPVFSERKIVEKNRK